MQDLTIGQISTFLAYVAALGGSCAVIVKGVSKAVEKALKPLNDKIDKVDLNATKNFLVARLDDIDNGQVLEGVNKERFYEQLKHYTDDLKGNSYILAEVEKQKREGKL